MTFTSTSRADWLTQAHSEGTRRSPGWTLADEREARTAREEEMTTAAHPQTARRRPGAQESQGSPGEAENDAPWGAGDASLPQGHPPPARGASRGDKAPSPFHPKGHGRAGGRHSGPQAGGRRVRTPERSSWLLFIKVPVIKFSLLSNWKTFHCLTV